MEAKLERELNEQLKIAARIMEDGRQPTPEERARFLELKNHTDDAPQEWRDRLADAVNRLASFLESMGI